eukprot:Nk52_evm1s1256 gene=Nk52_evmTU1s1256
MKNQLHFHYHPHNQTKTTLLVTCVLSAALVITAIQSSPGTKNEKIKPNRVGEFWEDIGEYGNTPNLPPDQMEVLTIFNQCLINLESTCCHEGDAKKNICVHWDKNANVRNMGYSRELNPEPDNIWFSKKREGGKQKEEEQEVKEAIEKGEEMVKEAIKKLKGEFMEGRVKRGKRNRKRRGGVDETGKGKERGRVTQGEPREGVGIFGYDEYIDDPATGNEGGEGGGVTSPHLTSTHGPESPGDMEGGEEGDFGGPLLGQGFAGHDPFLYDNASIVVSPYSEYLNFDNFFDSYFVKYGSKGHCCHGCRMFSSTFNTSFPFVWLSPNVFSSVVSPFCQELCFVYSADDSYYKYSVVGGYSGNVGGWAGPTEPELDFAESHTRPEDYGLADGGQPYDAYTDKGGESPGATGREGTRGRRDIQNERNPSSGGVDISPDRHAFVDDGGLHCLLPEDNTVPINCDVLGKGKKGYISISACKAGCIYASATCFQKTMQKILKHTNAEKFHWMLKNGK